MIITIDGPAGSGKSTVARKLATRLGFIHLNSGALFRAVAVVSRARGVDKEDEEQLTQLSRELRFTFELTTDKETKFFVNGASLSHALSGEEVGALASAIGLLPTVREVLLNVQRDVGTKHSLVVEGRDSGTVVFPDASKKFFLVASEQARAKRRLKQLFTGEEADDGIPSELLKKSGWENDSQALEAIQAQLASRDRQDTERKIAPHRKAEDAVEIDTSEIGPDAVVDKIISLL